MYKHLKILDLIIHCFFFALGIFLAFNLFESEILKKALFIYIIVYLSVRIIYDIINRSYPRFIGILAAFSYLFSKYITNSFEIFQQDSLFFNLITLSIVIAGYFISSNILMAKNKIEYKKHAIHHPATYYLINYTIYTASILSVIALIISILNLNKLMTLYSLAIMLVIYPHLNSNIFSLLKNNIIELAKSLGINLNFDSYNNLAKLHNFVFQKEDFFKSYNFYISDESYNTSETVTSLQQLSLQLSDDWKPEYSVLFVNDTISNSKIDYNIVHKDDNGITVIDENAVMYHFGNYSYVKEKIKISSTANLFLLRNEKPIAKYTINAMLDSNTLQFFKQLRKIGEKILLYKGPKENLYKNLEKLFDKIYYNVTDKDLRNIVKEIKSKKSSAFFKTAKKEEVNYEYCIDIFEKSQVKSKKSIIIKEKENLKNIVNLILSAKKLKSLTKKMLLASICTNMLLIIFAIIFYQKISLVLLISLLTTVLSELTAKIWVQRACDFSEVENTNKII